ncbi:mechanosensitive ion channel domain-containing protein [uncultured Helicobacter sp.]|uniref:mechanosensitive ion channel domain-containing protein n=1 Tax=uncultured Helicobacter sp. TaxID=175537 RepID=UPI002622E76F|nr:mechanosensitive ion channel domain-containing protein [uncultured Helicobacter sp.]
MLRKIIFLLLPLVFWAQDYQALIQEIVTLNAKNQNLTSTQEILKLSAKKERIYKEIINSLTTQKPDFSTTLQTTIQNLELSLKTSTPSPQILARNTLELNALLAQREMQNLAIAIYAKNSLFTTQSQISELIERSIQRLKSYTIIPTKGLTPAQEKELQAQIARFEIMSESYIEILSFMQTNVKLLTTQSVWSNINLPSLLAWIQRVLPENISSLMLAKSIVSISVFVILFFFRHLIAHLIIKLLGFFSKFLKNQEVQEKIKHDISKPILWFLIISSISISLAILAFPKPASPDFVMWVNASYIITLSWLAISLFKGYGIAILGSIAEKNNTFRREVINLLLKITYFLIILVAVLVLLKNFGFNISALIASLGIGGLAVAFAVKDMLANFFASVVLLFDNSFNQGDWIVCGDIEGTVVEMGLRRTTIRTFDNAMLFVPNSLLANSSVRNWNRRKRGRRIRMQIGVTYSSTPDQIRSCVKDIKTMLLNHPKIAKDTDERPPLSHYELDLKQNIVSLDDLLGYKSNLFVVLDEFADSSINILVYCFSTTVNWGEWLDVRQDVMLKIMDIIASHNLSFAFPSQSLYIEEMPKVSLAQS